MLITLGAIVLLILLGLLLYFGYKISPFGADTPHIKSKKYTILEDEYISHEGKKLFRIQALKNGNLFKKDEYGGFVEGYQNLSQHGSSWISNEAKAFEHGQVVGNALLSDQAEISGHAELKEHAVMRGKAKAMDKVTVGGYAQVFGEAAIMGNATVSGKARIYEKASLAENAKAFENADIHMSATVFGNAKIGKDGKIMGDAKIGGTAKVENRTVLSGETLA